MKIFLFTHYESERKKNMARNKVEISGVNTSTLPVLTNEEMKELFIRMQNGDQMARNDLVEGNLKLVLSILRRFKTHDENLDDLFQIGCVGLVKAIDHFDLAHEVKFSTYAVPMIVGEIKRYLRDNNSVRISRSIKDLAYKTLRLKEEYFMDHGIEPQVDYLANQLGVDSYDIIYALDALKDPISMFEPIYNDGGDTIYLCDQIEDKKKTGTEMVSHLATKDALSLLNSREQFILDERFVVGKTQMEIADELSISQAQVSRLEKNAIKQLKKILK